MREKYDSLSLGALKEIAKARGLKGISTLKKSELVERMVQEDEKDKKAAEQKKQEEASETTAERRTEIRTEAREEKRAVSREEIRRIAVQERLWSSLSWTAELR